MHHSALKKNFEKAQSATADSSGMNYLIKNSINNAECSPNLKFYKFNFNTGWI